MTASSDMHQPPVEDTPAPPRPGHLPTERKGSSHVDSGYDEAIVGFFSRNGFDPSTKDVCDQFAKARFPDLDLTPVKSQGYCSYTLALGDAQIMQFRPDAFSLDQDLTVLACHLFRPLVPCAVHWGTVTGIPAVPGSADSQELSLHAYVMFKVHGLTLQQYRETMARLPLREAQARRKLLVQDIADVFATSYNYRQRPWAEGARPKHVTEFSKGMVGSSLRWRVDLLKGLGSEHLLDHVSEVQQGLGRLEDAAWCLTHGDLVPANIMVDPESGHIAGLIDWAEGEWLPFGVGLYGLEEFLGEDVPSEGFRYYPEHEKLREVFWQTFMKSTRYRPGIYHLPVDDIALARKLGILLWRGLAFEDGRIDRAVEAGKDDSELQKLELFLQATDGLEVLRLGQPVRRPPLWIRQIWAALRAGATLAADYWARTMSSKKTEPPAVSKRASLQSDDS